MLFDRFSIIYSLVQLNKSNDEGMYTMGKFYAGLNKDFLFEKPIYQIGHYFKGPVLLKQSL